MIQTLFICVVLVALALLPAGQAVASNQVFKCTVNGSVTFQNSPCPVEKLTRPPTKDELNAERKKRLAEAAALAASAPKVAPKGQESTSASEASVRESSPNREPAFRCDGRQHCSQMRSCAEAKYFLANCPDVKMDGNRDGTPCEQQWCTHPFAK
jgi:Skp family chaperone for outer membrane proteins